MFIRVSCPNPGCGAVANVEEQSLGKRGRCKKCGHVFALARPDGGSLSGGSEETSAWKNGSSEPASPTNLPEQFGRYRIIRQLGQGGMGAVYLAHDTKLRREIALKVPYFNPADGPQAVERFEREARAVATLDHPNLCQVFDVGEVDGIHFLTMPYIQGKSLSEAITHNQTLSETQAAAIVLKLAQALQEAHDKGIIHRDLKPSNIMVNRRRELIVMDFGLARVVNSDDHKPITRSGHVIGTALYMAPEQASGALSAIGPTADVYSLGLILYELLTGRLPFEGPWALVIGLKNVKDPEPPSNHRPELNPTLNAICHKAIAKQPKDRYTTMSELAVDLAEFLKFASIPALRPPTNEAAPAARKLRRLSAAVVLGIIRQTVSRNYRQQPKNQPRLKLAHGAPPGRSFRPWMIGAAGPAARLLLGVIIYLATDKGRIKLEVNDPKAIVKIDGKEVLIEGLGEPITLKVGEHDYTIKWGNGEFKTDRFVVKRGNNEDLKIDFEPKPIAKLAQPMPEKPVPEKVPEAKMEIPPAAKPTNDEAAKFRADLANFEPLPFTRDLPDWWKVGSGSWEVSDDGVLTISREDLKDPKSAIVMLFSKRDDFRDFKLRFEVLTPDDSQTRVALRSRWDNANNVKSAYIFAFGGTRTPYEQDSTPIGSIGVIHDVATSESLKEWSVLARKVPVTAGEWQQIEITAVGRRMTTRLNGEIVAEFLDDRGGIEVGQIVLMPGVSWTKFKNLFAQRLDASGKPR